MYAHFKRHGRVALPWRATEDPYRILVSEVMLQQTQVDRVVPFYTAFLKKFPTVHHLASAPLSSVLRLWQGLGYNRRGKMLHDAVKIIITEHGGRVPKDPESLERLPGIGPYTARAICAFAFDLPVVFIETNIRTVFIHHFFPRKRKVHDTQLVRYIALVLDTKRPRRWYSALMDYGAYLKKVHGNDARRSAHHVRQKAFKGSDREIRGAVLKSLAEGEKMEGALLSSLSFPKARIGKQLVALAAEGMISAKRGRLSLG